MKQPTLCALFGLTVVLGASGCAVDTSDDVGEEKSVTDVAAADSVAGVSEVEGVDGADAIAAAAHFATAPAKGCRSRALDPVDPHVVHVTLDGCSGRFDRHVLAGHLTVTFSNGTDGSLHVAGVSDDLSIDGRPFTRTSSSDVRFEGTRRIVKRHVEQTGTKKTGDSVAQTKDVTVTFDTTTRCRDESGTAHAVVGGDRSVSTTIDLHTCETASGDELCPTGRIEHDRGAKKVVVTFDGSTEAQVSIDGGRRPKQRSWTLACTPR